MMMCAWCLFLIALVILTIAGDRVVQGACETGGRAAECLPRPSKLSTLTRDSCHSFVPGMVGCVRKQYSDCAQGNKQVMSRLNDPEVIRNYLKYFCDNLHVAVARKVCIDEHMDAVDQCYTTVLNWRTANPFNTTLDGSEKSMKHLCTLHDKMLDCYDHFKLGCGDKVANLYRALALVLRPPKCITRSFPGLGQGVYGHGASIYGNVGLVTCIIVVGLSKL